MEFEPMDPLLKRLDRVRTALALLGYVCAMGLMIYASLLAVGA